MPVTLAYAITEWEEDPEIPIIEWKGEVDISADALVSGPTKRMGPEAIAQEAISEVLEDMFRRKDTWPSAQVLKELRATGCSTNKGTIGKVKKRMGIVNRPVFEDGSIRYWVWTTDPGKLKVSDAHPVIKH